MNKIPLSDIIEFQNKSHIKAGDGLSEGKFPFFTSSSSVSKFCDSSQFNNPSLIFGTGGNASIHICETPFSVSTDCLVAQLKSEAVKSYLLKYIYFFLHGNIWILEEGFRGAGLKHISKNYINKILIPEISLKDQKRIVTILDQADSLIQKRKQAIYLLDEYLKSVFLDMFGDPFSNIHNYNILKIEDVARKEKNSIVDGPFGSSLNNNDYYESGVPIIRINNVRDSGFYNKNFKYISEEKYNELIRSKVEFNDILIPRVGNSIGKLCVFNQKYKALLSTTGVAKVTFDFNKVTLEFVLQQMRLPQYSKYIWDQCEGGGQPYLNLNKIKNLIILVP